MEFVNTALSYITDSKRRLSSKAAFIVLVIAGVVIFDNLIGWSFYYEKDKQISTLERVGGVLKDSTQDSATKALAINVREDVFARKNYAERLSFGLRKMLSAKPKKPAKNNPTDIPINKEVSIKNNFWFTASASGLYFLFAFLIIPILLFTDRKTPFFQMLATGLISVLIFTVYGFFFYWLISFIPQISDKTWAWNYLLNFILQIGFPVLFVYGINKLTKNNEL